jgi:hypothetical protein
MCFECLELMQACSDWEAEEGHAGMLIPLFLGLHSSQWAN